LTIKKGGNNGIFLYHGGRFPDLSRKESHVLESISEREGRDTCRGATGGKGEQKKKEKKKKRRGLVLWISPLGGERRPVGMRGAREKKEKKRRWLVL